MATLKTFLLLLISVTSLTAAVSLHDNVREIEVDAANDVTSTTVSTCVDEIDNCNTDLCQSPEDYKEMCQYCPLTCGFCGTNHCKDIPTLPPPGVCADVASDCDPEYCKPVYHFVMCKNCRKTCNLCKKC